MSNSLIQDILLVEIAKAHPKVLVDAYKIYRYGKGWEKEVIKLMKTDNFIAAVKKCRELTGMGLKEAKEICDELKMEMNKA